MDNEEFRKRAHELVDWMADYLRDIEKYPVRSQVLPGEIKEKLPPSAPLESTDFPNIMRDFENIVMPGITHWQHPSFFAYFPGNASPPSLLAEMLTSTLAAQCMLWQTSPAANELEHVVLDWLRQMLNLPETMRGVIQDSATSATLVALIAAREQASHNAANDVGLQSVGGRLRIYCSDQAHSSIEKGVKACGIGRENLVKVATNEAFSMDPFALKQAISNDLEAGYIPTCIVASIGATGTGGIDPLYEIGRIAKSENIWLHVDAAWAGSALILPEYQDVLKGIDAVDSFVFNPHKWLLTNFDCSAFYVKDTQRLDHALSLVPAYLESREKDQVVDYQNWSIPLGRRFRALKLWFVLRSYGVKGLQTFIRSHIEWANDLEKRIAETENFELTSARKFALLSFRYTPDGVQESELNAINQRLLEALNDSGKIYLTQNKLGDKFVIRFQIGGQMTKRHHVEDAWKFIVNTARDLKI